MNAPIPPAPPTLIQVCGFDTETHLIAPGNIFPRLVCSTFDVAQEGLITPSANIKDTFKAWGMGNSDPQMVQQLLEMFQAAYQRLMHIVIQNAAYDLGVVLQFCMDIIEKVQLGDPKLARELYLLIWEVLDQGLDDEMAGGRPMVHCTIIREKLWHLSTTGNIETLNGRELRFGLSDLVQSYFGIDISDLKVEMGKDGRIYDHNGNDVTDLPIAGAAWRLRYSELDGVPMEKWPLAATEYAISDSTWARKIYEVQESQRAARGYGSMNSEALQVYADLALRIYSAPGFMLDKERVKKVEASIDLQLSQVREILRLNGIERADGSVNQKVVMDRVEQAWQVKGRHPLRTTSGRISFSGEVLEELDGIDPILDAFSKRQEVSKIKTAFLPNIQGDRVWSNYDILKETGRTSSYGSGDRSRRKPLYDAVNIQQIPRGHGIRECFLPPPGYVLCSMDYSALELCSVAQVTYSLLGFSVHREKNLQGYDLHSYLGSGMAMALAPQLVNEAAVHEQAYQNFRANMKGARKFKDDDKSPEAEWARKLAEGCKHYRNFSKPVGLGYPGGLGPATLVTLAKGTYGVTIDEDQARVFRELWHQTYPEMKMFFRWVEQQVDHANKDSQGFETYCYETSGFNRFRAGASYCATANGKGMQSLSADGAKRSVCWIARACAAGLPDDNVYSLAADCIPMAFIHDENIVAIPDDELATERALLLSQLMVQAMYRHMPDVLIQAEPAFMRRWSKKAGDPEWRDEPGRLERVYAALEARRPGFADQLGDALGATYNPDKRLVPWHDVHKDEG